MGSSVVVARYVAMLVTQSPAEAATFAPERSRPALRLLDALLKLALRRSVPTIGRLAEIPRPDRRLRLRRSLIDFAQRPARPNARRGCSR